MRKQTFFRQSIIFALTICGITFVGKGNAMHFLPNSNLEEVNDDQDEENTGEDQDSETRERMTMSNQSASNLYSYPPKVVPDTPTSPQAQAFTRIGNYEINNSSGIPDIGLPLFQIDYYGFTIPLNLRYEARPLKPGYNYDVYGLGWALSGNACVSRTIHDRADEENNFALSSFTTSNNMDLEFIQNANQLDRFNFQYDDFNITLPSGRNIPFYIHKDYNTIKYTCLSSDKDVEIECIYTSSNIYSFKVTDENGIIYRFNDADEATNGYLNDSNAGKNVAWMLSSISIPNKGTILYEYNDTISFHENTQNEPFLRISRLKSYINEEVPEPELIFNITMQESSSRYKMRTLRKITYGPSCVEFQYTPDGKHLSNMTIKDNGTVIRNYQFLIADSFLSRLIITGTNATDKLIYNFGYRDKIPGTQTDYWGNCCVGRYGTAEDIGNFNIFIEGANNISESSLETYMLPLNNHVRKIEKKATDIDDYFKFNLQSLTDGESRYASSPENHGVLSSIVYPNGGRTVFEFENHRFPTATAADGDFIFNRRNQRIIEGGGFRIKSIKNYAADGTLVNQDHYRYGFTYQYIQDNHFPLPLPDSYSLNRHIGCGEAVVDPNILTFLSYDYSQQAIPRGFAEMILGIPISGSNTFQNYTIGNGTSWWWEARFSVLNFRRLVGTRNAVVYPEITVYHGDPEISNSCIGKTIYKYDIYAYDLSASRYYLSRFGQTNSPDTAYFEPVKYLNFDQGPTLICEELPHKRDHLVSKSEFGRMGVADGVFAWPLYQKENYIYDEDFSHINGHIYNSYISRGHCAIHNLGECPLSLSSFYDSTTKNYGRSRITGKTTLQYSNNHEDSISISMGLQFTLGNSLKRKTYWDEYEKVENYVYAGNCPDGDALVDSLKSRHIFSSLISGITTAYVYSLPRTISGYHIEYGLFNGAILPKKLYKLVGNNYEESIEIVSYTSHGHPTETIDLKTGMHTAYIWGYDDRYLVLQADNATYNQVHSSINGLVLDNTLTISSFDTVRNSLPDAMIQIWTHYPLKGVKEYSDHKGQTFEYSYDGLGRLIQDSRVKNQQPEILHDYQYDFRNRILNYE